MTRIQIIAQLDAEITRLERARDFLAAALKNSKIISAKSILSASKAASTLKGASTHKSVPAEKPLSPIKPERAAKASSKTKAKPPAQARTKGRKQPPVAAAAIEQNTPEEVSSSAMPSPQPQIRRVPPRRRMERRASQVEKTPAAALRGSVPAGPVAVSANEARKQQERSAQPAPTPIVPENRSELGSERSLGSLIQAFERRAGISRLPTP